MGIRIPAQSPCILEVVLVVQGGFHPLETVIRRSVLRGRTHIALQGYRCREVLDFVNRQSGPVGALPILLNHDRAVRDVVNRLASISATKVNCGDSIGNLRSTVGLVCEVEVVLGRVLRHLVRLNRLGLKDVVQSVETIYTVVVYRAFVAIRDVELAVSTSRISCHRFIGRRVTGLILVRREFNTLDRHVSTSVKLREIIGVGRVVVGEDNIRGLIRDDLSPVDHHALANNRGAICIHRVGGLYSNVVAKVKVSRIAFGNLVVPLPKRNVVVTKVSRFDGVLVVAHLSVGDMLLVAIGNRVTVLIDLNDVEDDLLLLLLGENHVSSEPLGDDHAFIVRIIPNLHDVTDEVDVYAVFARVVRVVRVIGDDEAIQRRIKLLALGSLGLLKVVNGILLERQTMEVPVEQDEDSAVLIWITVYRRAEDDLLANLVDIRRFRIHLVRVADGVQLAVEQAEFRTLKGVFLHVTIRILEHVDSKDTSATMSGRI